MPGGPAVRPVAALAVWLLLDPALPSAQAPKASATPAAIPAVIFTTLLLDMPPHSSTVLDGP
jgi:hypothetical protein